MLWNNIVGGSPCLETGASNRACEVLGLPVCDVPADFAAVPWMEITSLDQSGKDVILWYHMREALTEVIDLLIMYARGCGRCMDEHWRGSQNIYTVEMHTYAGIGFTALQSEGRGGDGGFLVFPQWKTNADKPQQHGEVTSEMLASIDGPVLFQASVSHSMAQCTREHGIHNPNKTKQCAR